MALTNYMTQVILLYVLFTPHGFGLKVPAPMVLAGRSSCSGPVALSRWWLERFHAGPLEWLWRWSTAMKRRHCFEFL
jgi:uncharacterized protein